MPQSSLLDIGNQHFALQERTKKRKAEEKAAAAEAAARQAYGGGAGLDPLMGGRFDENCELRSSPGDAG